MKKTLVAVLATALLLTLFGTAALAYTGDVTTSNAKVYSTPAMTEYVGTIPAGTSVLVRAYEKYADVYYNGKVVYIETDDLLHTNLESDYIATLTKGTKIYQQAKSSAKSLKLKSSGTVKVCAISGDWALVQSTGAKRLYAFVKIADLTAIRTK